MSDAPARRRMRVRASAVAIGAVLVTGAVSAAAGGKTNKTAALTLTRNGQPAAAIVLEAKPTKAAQFAAFELQWHVKAISGATLPIVRGAANVPKGHVAIYVGDGARARELGLGQAALKLQEYALRYGSGQIVLVGKDADVRTEVKHDLDLLGNGQKNANWPGFWEARGTLHAVYDFLRDACGVRWLDPSDTGTVIPRRPTLAVTGTDVRRTPTFRYRHSGVDASVDGYDARVSIWGGPAQGPKAAGFKAWEAAAYTDLHRRYPGNGYTWAKRHTLRLFLLRMRNGGEKCLCNHSLYHYYELYWKPSPNKANAKHFVRKRPELFARGYKGDPPPQMCYTSRALVETVAQEARDYFDKGGYPYKVILSNAPRGLLWGENFFAVEPMDNSLFCRCPACQKWIALGKGHGNVPHYSQGIHSDYFFQFVNAVQKEFAKTHAGKGKRLVTLAYMTHAWPAKSAKLDPAVAVQFCFASSSAPYRRAEYENEIRLVRRWADEAKSSGRALYLWLYHGLYRYAADCGNYFCFPGFFAHAIADQMKLFKRLGYRGMLHCGLAPEIDTYVTFRLMDNADLDVDALLDDYFTGLYGAAAAPLKKLYLAIEAVYCDPSARPEKRGASGAETIWTRLGTRQRMAAFGQLMAEAHARAATQREKRNVKAFDLSIWQYMTAGRAQYDRRMIAPIPTVRAPAVPDAGGDPTQVAWDTAAPMGGDWFVRGGSTPAPRRFSGRLAHDAKYLYVELVDPCKSKALVVSPLVSCYDDWELFFAGQRGMPYRQFMVGPTGMVVALLNGEVNWRMYVRLHEHGIRVASDTSTGDKWVSRIAIPLEQVVPGGAKPGDTVYLNVVRVTSPQVGGGHPYSIATWVSHTTVHDVDRLAAITLEK